MSREVNFRENENWTSSQPDDENQTKEKFDSTGEGIIQREEDEIKPDQNGEIETEKNKTEPNKEETAENKYKNFLEEYRNATKKIAELKITEKIKAGKHLNLKEQIAWMDWQNLYNTKKTTEKQRKDAESMVEIVEDVQEKLETEAKTETENEKIIIETEKEQAIKEQQELDEWRNLKDKELLTDEAKNLLSKLEEKISGMEQVAKVLGTIEIGKEEELRKEKEEEFEKLKIDYTYFKDELRKLERKEELVKKEIVEDEEINDDEIKVDKKIEKKGILESLKGLFGKK